MKKIILLTTVALVLASVVSNAQIPTDGLVGAWLFDDETVNDASGNGYNGTPTPGLSYVIDRDNNANSAVKFNGSDNIDLSAHYTSLINSTGSISLWFKQEVNDLGMLVGFGEDGSTGNLGYIFVGGNMTSQYPDESLGFIIYSSGNYMVSGFVNEGTDYYNDGQWHHLLFMVGTVSHELYIDGQPQTLSYIYGSQNDGNFFMNVASLNKVFFGQRTYPGYPNYFQGSLDDVRIYDRTMTTDEIGILSETSTGTGPGTGESVWTKNTDNTIYYNDGNVGIGTDDPVRALHIISENDPKIYLEGTSTTTTDPTLNFRIDGEQYGVIGWDLGDNVMKFKAGIAMTGTEGINIDPNNNVGFGTANIPTGYKLAVNGKIIATEIKVEVYPWADFVFQDDYNLMNLSDLETYINKNKHLPDIPSETEVEENGISVGEMNAKLLQKIEELTLYVIELQKKNTEQDMRIKELESK